MNSPRSLFRSAWLAVLALSLLPFSAVKAVAVPTEDGLYATFKTTHGTFVIDLAFEDTPRTVANFVGLAEGSRAWIDFQTGRVSREPYYDGLEIPRAESGFVIQFGSPNNTLSGGPGYRIPDQFHPDQRHNEAGIISMASGGTADTAGSQAFITLGSATSLNNRFAAFGRTVEGLDVVLAIGELAGGTVTINRVIITRAGTDAKSFDVNAWGLPDVSESPVELDFSDAPTSYLLKFPRTPFTEYYTFDSPTLSGTPGDSEAESFFLLDAAPQEDLDVTARTSGQDQLFFNVAEVKYSEVPISINGKTVEFYLISSDPDQFLTMTFTAEPRGTTDFSDPLGTFSLSSGDGPPTTGRIGAYSWTQTLQRGVLGVTLESIGTFFFYQRFQSDGNSGSFSAHNSSGSVAGPFPFFGDFTIGTTGLP